MSLKSYTDKHARTTHTWYGHPAQAFLEDARRVCPVCLSISVCVSILAGTMLCVHCCTLWDDFGTFFQAQKEQEITYRGFTITSEIKQKKILNNSRGPLQTEFEVIN